MTTALDEIIQVDNLRIAAITDCSTTKWGQSDVISVQCYKHPVAVLIFKEGEIHTHRPDGTHMRPDEVEQFYPGMIKEFARRCSSHGSG